MCPGQGLMASLVPSYWVLVAPSPPHTGRDNTKNVHPAKTPQGKRRCDRPSRAPRADPQTYTMGESETPQVRVPRAVQVSGDREGTGE